jgi:hypothetical protein
MKDKIGIEAMAIEKKGLDVGGISGERILDIMI